MGPANFADWAAVMEYLDTAEPCPQCRRLRTQEAEVTIRKRDSPSEKLLKGRKRRKILKELRLHQRLVSHDEAQIEWPSTGLDAMEHADLADHVAPLNPEEGKAHLVGTDAEQPLNSVVVGGAVPKHLRLIEQPISKDTMVVVRSLDEENKSVLYVGKVKEVQRHGDFVIHWWMNQGQQLQGKYERVWLDGIEVHRSQNKQEACTGHRHRR